MSETMNPEKLQKEARGLSADLAQRPTLPVAIFLQEASDLYTFASTEPVRRKLLAVGLESRHIDEMPEKIERLRALESLWILGRDRSRPEALRALAEQAETEYSDLWASARYALRNDPSLLALANELPDGSTQAQVIQGLSDMATLIARNRPAFDAINLEAGREDRARALGQQLQLAQSRYEASDAGDELLDLRDRAFGDLDQSVDEVRAAGLYAFRKDKDLLYRFRSNYFLKSARRTRSRDKSNATATPAKTSPSATSGSQSTSSS